MSVDTGTRNRLVRGADRLPVDVEDGLREVRRRAARREVVSRATTVALAVGVAAVGIVGVWRLIGLRNESGLGTSPGGRIGYTALNDEAETLEIYSVGGNGSDVTRLLPPGETGYLAAVSPDGSRVAFITGSGDNDGAVVIRDLENGEQRAIVPSEQRPSYMSWSPDGSRIAYVTSNYPNEALWTVNADGTGAQRILEGHWRNVVWSPDGELLLLAGAGLTDRSEGGEDMELHTVQPDGSALTRLTSNQVDEDFPSWSPDGSRIAFVRHEFTGDDVDFHSDIFVMNADGSGERRLTEWPGFDAFPVWSPDGSRILFSSDRHLSEEQRARNEERRTLAGASLFLMDPDTGRADLFLAGGDEALLASSWIA